MTYFISDLHLGHRSVISMCNRPYSSVNEMDEAIISNWNKRVKGNDTVYIIGDIAHKSAIPAEEYLKRLKGHKVLIVGNHDRDKIERPEVKACFDEITSYKELRVDNHWITLCHYPMLEWKNSRKEGSKKLGYLIFGHIHNSKSDYYRPLFELGNALNAGADINGFVPVTLPELIKNNECFKLDYFKDAIDRAKFLSRSYHMHQCDKSGAAYYLHPLYVSSHFDEPSYVITALLHDTLEDTELSPETVKREFGDEVLSAVLALTHDSSVDYIEYAKALKNDPIARAVKIEDLRHNMDLTRLPDVKEEDIARVEKYKKILEFLLSDT